MDWRDSWVERARTLPHGRGAPPGDALHPFHRPQRSSRPLGSRSTPKSLIQTIIAHVAEALTFTFAGDESGDVSFSFGKGATRYFVIAVIATCNPETLRAVLEDFRRIEHLPQHFEFHFNALSSSQLRQKVFTTLKSADFEYWALIVDKTTLPDIFKLMDGQDIYLYFISELIRQIPLEKRNAGTLILDEFGSIHLIRQEFRRVLKARGISHGFKRIFVRQSHRETLIQVADLIAGAIFHRDAKKDSAAFEIIQDKAQRIFEYGA